tara:strand:- start:230 stop:592 length:363 start_codon:yes stop_codon:yes gene_type:complete
MPVEKETIKLGGKKIEIKKGALSKQLGIPEEKDIPKSLLTRINAMDIGESITYRQKTLRITRLLKQRVSLAITLKGMRGEKKGSVSKTHKGEQDYTTKKGDKDFHSKSHDIKKKRKPYSK